MLCNTYFPLLATAMLGMLVLANSEATERYSDDVAPVEDDDGFAPSPAGPGDMAPENDQVDIDPPSDGSGSSDPDSGDGPEVKELTLDDLSNFVIKADTDLDGNVSMNDLMSLGRRLKVAAAKKSNVMEFLDDEGEIEDFDPEKTKKLTLNKLLSRWKTHVDMGGEQKEYAHRYMKLEKTMFNAADRDNDGVLKGDELRIFFHPILDDEMLTQAAEAFLQSKDRNHDKRLSLKEFATEGDRGFVDNNFDISDIDRATFELLDTDMNGFLNVTEMKEWEAGMVDFGKPVKEFMKEIDRNRDGNITVKEVEKRGRLILDSMLEAELEPFIRDTLEL